MDTLPREVVTVSKYELEPFKQGRRVGCYLLGKTLGEGSFAKVKEAIHIVTGEKVAVKIIDKKRAKDDGYISKNLRREARILQLVRHPNIIQLFEVLETDNYYYLIMEHCIGGELLDYICSRKRLEESTARRLVSQLVSAVDVMHKSGIVHRDLKIENFLLNENEDLKIIDFGLSNTLPSSCLDAYEKTGVFPQLLNTHCGSPAYAAPELLAQKQYGPQVDVWSIGINMYAMLTGFLPYMMEPFNVMEMYEKMMQRKMTPVPGFLSRECRDLLMRLLEPVPEWRISLKQVMKHKWFTGSNHIPQSPSLGDLMYNKKELCESVLNYMKYSLKIKNKDTINAVVCNRSVHASAIYHLLVKRLDRYLAENKGNMNNQFSKVEVIKKLNLTTDANNNATPSKGKRFSFRGKKIDPNSRSQPELTHEQITYTNEHSKTPHEYKSQIDYTDNQSYNHQYEKHDDGTIKHECNGEKDSASSPTRKAAKTCSKKTNNKINWRTKRSASSNDTAAIAESIRNSLTSSSKDFSSKSVMKSDTPKTPVEESFVASRKKSVDGFFKDSSPDNKIVDVRKYLADECSKRNNKLKQTESVDDTENEEQKESAPGWLITKIVKQPLLKAENLIRDEAPKSTGELVNSLSADDTSGKQSPKRSPYLRRVSDQAREKILKQSVIPEVESTITRPKTPEKVKTIKRPQTPEFSHNFRINSNTEALKKPLARSQSDSNNNTNQQKLTKTSDSKVESESKVTPSPELEQILQSVRYINQHHLKDKNTPTDSERLPSTKKSEDTSSNPTLDQSAMRTVIEGKPRTKRVHSLPGNETTNDSSWWQQKRVASSAVHDENNNFERKRVVGTPNKGFVKDRMAKWATTEKAKEEVQSTKTPSHINTINKISPTKKTLELNVTQFAQFKTETRAEENGVSLKNGSKGGRALKPLQINFNFKLHRKKKPYNQKQQTRSLTDITMASKDSDAKPTEQQLLSPKNKYNEDKNDVQRQINQEKKSEKTDGDKMAQDNTMIVQSHKPRVTVTSRSSGKAKTGAAKIFITSKQQNDKSEKSSSNDGKDAVKNVESVTKDTTDSQDVSSVQRIKTLRQKFEISNSFDSGFFGNYNSSSTDDENTTSPCAESPTKTKSFEKMQAAETHCAKYRCQPVYQAEVTTTPPVYRDSAAELGMIREEVNCPKPIIRRWGSVSLEPTQERFTYIPRSAEIKQNLLQKNREQANTKTTPGKENNNTSVMQKKVRAQPCKQYPIERTVVGPASPKFQQSAKYGLTRSKSSPITDGTPTLFDKELEREKIMSFAHALESAAWRKRSAHTLNGYR